MNCIKETYYLLMQTQDNCNRNPPKTLHTNENS
uniref:Uncharacterized protein n=1 Tax=Rhizophora mucronata TaxID=61149 RepID=A0A2P2ITG9_RHIMU